MFPEHRADLFERLFDGALGDISGLGLPVRFHRDPERPLDVQAGEIAAVLGIKYIVIGSGDNSGNLHQFLRILRGGEEHLTIAVRVGHQHDIQRQKQHK